MFPTARDIGALDNVAHHIAPLLMWAMTLSEAAKSAMQQVIGESVNTSTCCGAVVPRQRRTKKLEKSEGSS